jgi:hypothetical protein
VATKKSSSGVKSADHSSGSESESNRRHPAPSVQPVEPDAKHTGGSPNRQRGAVRGNTEEGAGEQHPEQPAAQHATGSFTGEGREAPRSRKKSGQR